jgi:sterol desaturase/sphingolipid hydroxylase (fatty acid hydroxylase superfamily)
MENTILIALLATYGLFLVLDMVAPARRFPAIRGWRVKGLLFFVLFNVLGMTLPAFWDALLAERRLIDASGLGVVGGGLLGLVVVQFFSYWWHRTMHRVPLLWRWFHQMHHSAERVDVFGAFYFSPLDMIGFLFAGSLGMVWAVGLSAEAAMLANAVATFCAFFQHSNVKTPRWLGYFIQRPENHATHHERGVHAFNYGDIPLWDIVFGTFRNPAAWNGQAGFHDGASQRVGDMLLGRDVSIQSAAVRSKTQYAAAEPIA